MNKSQSQRRSMCVWQWKNKEFPDKPVTTWFVRFLFVKGNKQKENECLNITNSIPGMLPTPFACTADSPSNFPKGWVGWRRGRTKKKTPPKHWPAKLSTIHLALTLFCYFTKNICFFLYLFWAGLVQLAPLNLINSVRTGGWGAWGTWGDQLHRLKKLRARM